MCGSCYIPISQHWSTKCEEADMKSKKTLYGKSSKNVDGTSLVVPVVELPPQAANIWSLVRELRSHLSQCGQKKKKEFQASGFVFISLPTYIWSSKSFQLPARPVSPQIQHVSLIISHLDVCSHLLNHHLVSTTQQPVGDVLNTDPILSIPHLIHVPTAFSTEAYPCLKGPSVTWSLPTCFSIHTHWNPATRSCQAGFLLMALIRLIPRAQNN